VPADRSRRQAGYRLPCHRLRLAL